MKTFADFNISIPPNSSGDIKTTCPECSPQRKKPHDKCLSVNIENGIWLCHHCGYKGGLNGKADNGYQPRQYTRPEFKQAPVISPVVEYFQKRGIPEVILKKEQISYEQKNGKGWILFPYFKDGECVNIKYRSHQKEFHQTTNAEKCLYRFDAALTHPSGQDNTLIITEGEIDTLSFLVAGFEAVVSIPDGAPSQASSNYPAKFNFLDSAGPIFEKYNRVILAMDNDDPGHVAEAELARRIGVEKCWRVVYPDGCKDANDVLKICGAKELVYMVQNAQPFPVDGLLTTTDLTQDVFNLYNMGSVRGVSTGWFHFDEHYTVVPGELTIVTGIPQHGKSNFIDALTINLMRQFGWAFAMFSPENWPPQRHVQTLLEKYYKKPFEHDYPECQRMTKAEVERGIEELSRFYFFIVPKEEIMSIDTILEKARIAVFRHGIKGLVIDPWNEVEHNFDGLTEVQYISRELTKLRRFARFNGIHIWVIAHPKNLVKNNDGNYDPPTMYEISGGAHWRNKADNGLCVHRPRFDEDITEVHIQKIRFKETGRVGVANFRYTRSSGIYHSTPMRSGG